MKHVILKLSACVFLLVIALLPVLPVFSSNVSNADFYGVVQTSNNSTAATGVITTITGMNFTALIAGGFVNSSANNCAIQSSTGTDIPFMPGYGTNPTMMYNGSVGQNSIVNSIFYTKGVTGGAIRYFPGSTGMSVNDTASLEIGSNGTVEMTAYLGESGIVVLKSGAIDISYNATSENLSAVLTGGITFITDNWTDVGTPKISVDTTTNRLNIESELSAIDERCYYDTSGVGNVWTLNDTFCLLTANRVAPNNAQYYIGIFSALENPHGMAGDAAGYGIFNDGSVTKAVIFYSDGGIAWGADNIPISSNNTFYYSSFQRTSAISVTLSIYSDASMTTHIAGSPITAAIPATITGLRYLQVTNYDAGTSAATEITGWISNISSPNIPAIGEDLNLSLGGVTQGEYDITLTLDSTNATLSNGVTSNSALSGFSIPDTSGNWTFGSTATLYIEQMKVTVGGVTKGQWDWEYNTTFTDDSGNGNTGTPSFRTTGNDADVSSELILFQPIAEPIAPAFAVGEGPGFFDSSNVTSGNFTTGNVTLDYPLKDLIEDVATAGGVPYQIPSTFISSFCVIVLSMLTSFFLKRYSAQSIFLKTIVNTAAYGVLIALHIYDWWMLIFFFIFEASIWFGAQHRRE